MKRELSDSPGRRQGDGAAGEGRLAAFLMIAALMVLVVIAAAALAFYVSRAPESRADDVSVPVANPIDEAMALPEMVGVSIDTDIDGDLWIDGELFGPMSANEQLIVRLEPGAYRVEARHEGAVLASQLVTVEVGGAPTVSLRMPTGTDGSESGAPTVDPTTLDESDPDRPSPVPEDDDAPRPSADTNGNRSRRAPNSRSRVRDALPPRDEPRPRERPRRVSPPEAEPLPDNPFD